MNPLGSSTINTVDKLSGVCKIDIVPQTYNMEWSQCYWRLHYFYNEVKEYRWPMWNVKADYSKQSIREAWVEAVAKSNPAIRVRITCQNGKYIILDTRGD